MKKDLVILSINKTIGTIAIFRFVFQSDFQSVRIVPILTNRHRVRRSDIAEVLSDAFAAYA